MQTLTKHELKYPRKLVLTKIHESKVDVIVIFGRFATWFNIKVEGSYLHPSVLIGVLTGIMYMYSILKFHINTRYERLHTKQYRNKSKVTKIKPKPRHSVTVNRFIYHCAFPHACHNIFVTTLTTSYTSLNTKFVHFLIRIFKSISYCKKLLYLYMLVAV